MEAERCLDNADHRCAESLASEEKKTDEPKMPVTAEQVVWCYRSILGRDPDPGRPSREQLAVEDFPALVLHFIRSAEFRNKSRILVQPTSMVPLILPRAEIDCAATSEQLALLLDRVRQAWTHLGEVRPFHSVLSSERFLPKNIGKSEAEFWISGEREAAVIETLLAAQGVRDLGSKTAVEYGCGLGRITLPLGQRFASVHGYDISPTHLDGARARAQRLGTTNVEFHLRADNFFTDLEKCDFFYSNIVFQHNPPPIILQLIRLALKSLKPGGLAAFQCQVYRKDYSFSLPDYLAESPNSDMEMHAIPQAEVLAMIASSGCTLVEVREDGVWPGILSNMFVVRRDEVDGLRGKSSSFRQPPR